MIQTSDNTILSLDLGIKTGWALYKTDALITSGTIQFKTNRFEGGGMRYLKFKQWLTQLKNTHGQIDEVHFEEVRMHRGKGKNGRVTFNVDAAHAYGGFVATLTAWCEHHEIPYAAMPVGKIKKHITGKGNANKQAVIKAIKAKGFDPTDDNEADALALLDLILTQNQRRLI